MLYYNAWYRTERHGTPVDRRFADWVVRADDEADATRRVLDRLGRRTPERGFRVYLHLLDDEDEATIAFASARQNGTAIG